MDKIPMLSDNDIAEVMKDVVQVAQERLAKREGGLGFHIVVKDDDYDTHYKMEANGYHWKSAGKPYDVLANGKADVAIRCKMHTRDVRNYPILFRPGNVRWEGGTYENGLGIGISGLNPEDDHEVGMIALERLHTKARENFESWEKAQASTDPDYHYIH
jgi:hypothetical protein